MTTKLVTAIAIAAGVLIMPNVAQANGATAGLQGMENVSQIEQVKDTRKRNRGRAHRNRHHNKHRKFGGHFYVQHDFYGHNPYRSCRSLKRKARHTGSRFWWRKYRNCMERYYY